MAKIRRVKEYIVYVFNTENEDIKYFQNPCYLDFVRNNISDEKNTTDPTYVASYSSKDNCYTVKEEGIFITAVMANIEGKMLMKYIYNELKYNSSSEPYEPYDEEE